MDNSSPRSPGARPGVALLSALFFTAIITILLIVAVNFTQSSIKAGRGDKYHAEAYNMAHAGLEEAVGWFKRQSSQPVGTFNPQPNASTPVKGDTNDPFAIDPGGSAAGEPNLGIVQEIQLESNLYGRYEVGKITELDRDSSGMLRTYNLLEPNVSGSLAPVAVADSTSTSYEGVKDVSKDEGVGTSGQVWRIRSHGYIYRRGQSPDPSAPFYALPNQVLDQCELETEICMVHLRDYGAALVTGSGTGDTFNNGTNLTINGQSGIAVLYNPSWPSGKPTPNTPPTSFTGSQVYKQVGGWPNWLNWNEVFSVSSGTSFGALADIVESDPAKLPVPMSSMAMVYMKPSSGSTITFDAGHPLSGGGILAIDGNLTIAAGSNSTWNGLVYVAGDFTADDPFKLTGAVVCQGHATISSSTSTGFITYDNNVLDNVRLQLGQYRESRAALRTPS